MEKTNLKVTEISVADMLERSEKAYNPSIWAERVNRMAGYKNCQFYVIEPDGKYYSYARFFCSYIADGIYFFSDWHAFSSGISNNGFCKVFVDMEGFVWRVPFKFADGKEGYAKNEKNNRQYFREHLAPHGVMVSNNL